MSCLTMSPSSGSRSVNVAGEVVGWCFVWCAGRRRLGCHRSVCVDVTDLRKQLLPAERRLREPSENPASAAGTLLCCRNAVAADIVGTPTPAFMRVSGAKRSSQAENAGSIPVIRSGSRLTDHQMPRETVPVSGLLYRIHSVRDGQSNNGVSYFRKIVNDSTESLLAINAFSGASSSAYPSDSPHASNSPSAIGNSSRITR